MQAATERRTQDDDRVPLDALIELTHAEGSEVLEADAVDVSTGGLSLRASFVPPVGARMQCRFACPPRGDRVVADCEIMWSALEGPQAGAFGVRFLALDTRSATLIRRLLEPDDPSVQQARQDETPCRPALVTDDRSHPPALASLHIDGLGAPIEAEVQLDEDDHVLVRQELDFLRLGRGVRVDIEGARSRRGRIASVTLEQSTSDVPALSLGVLIDAAEPLHVDGAVRAQADEALDPEATKDGPAHELGPTDTWPQSPVFEEARAPAPALEETRTKKPAPPAVRASADAVDSTGSAASFAQALWDRSRPVLVQALARVHIEVGQRWPRYRDGLRAFWTLLRDWFASQAGRVKHVRRSHRKRRTTAPPPRTPRTRRATRGAAETAAPVGAGRGRLMLVGVLAFGGVAGAIYALAPRRNQGALELHRAVASAPQQQALAEPAPATAQPAEPLVAPSSEVDEPLPAPAGSAPPASAESSEGAGDAPREDSRAFGDLEVPNGRTYTLRMSGPVERIEGEKRRGGFMVRVPGRLSLDRASPIATSHPALSRSLILNQGDRAELTIEFVRGKQPKYRVEAEGSNLVITVERL